MQPTLPGGKTPKSRQSPGRGGQASPSASSATSCPSSDDPSSGVTASDSADTSSKIESSTPTSTSATPSAAASSPPCPVSPSVPVDDQHAATARAPAAATGHENCRHPCDTHLRSSPTVALRVAPLATSQRTTTYQSTRARAKGPRTVVESAVTRPPTCCATRPRSPPPADGEPGPARPLRPTQAVRNESAGPPRRIPSTPGATRAAICATFDLPAETVPGKAAEILGSGEDVSAQDTVPYCLWNVATCPDSYEEAMWRTVSGLGDRDTTCAIVGGIVALRVGERGVPTAWVRAGEQLPT
ncbi:MAG: ADP-ribosylglycohydrolase family protein [Deltaproteobacteria bacterium]|nr:ADP-ribosylglycohydrolase family protein [Deltaproteobacteria bacterium]